ncbi:NAD(P)H-hydrate dehydratase [Ilumatobacter sp.]|uniref:NAD(P)H-hydrate dehydratase n=1 Tax=Ilumatobacter sp. TaxID=1967498 RepID=UPI003752E785
MLPVLTPSQMAAVDAAATEPIDELIDRAGRAVARIALDMLGGSYGRVVVVIAGTGNNGADGRVAAEVLRRRGVQVKVFDAAALPDTLPSAGLVIDAAYGTGFRGEWPAPHVGATPVLAVDLPSGVDALTGVASGSVLRADCTITFQAMKPGLLFGDGALLAGRIEVADIGLELPVVDQHLLGAADVVAWWPRRATDAHKWRGAVRVIGGSEGMIGAARLCAEAAARGGAGLVKLSVPGQSIETRSEIVQLEVSTTGWAAEVLVDIDRFGALAIGPGLGRGKQTMAAVLETIGAAPVPTVIDGDALFALTSDDRSLSALLSRRTASTVLTPHDGEFRTLTGALPGSDRVAAARSLAADTGCTVLLKGPTTVVAAADGEVLLVDHGDERLATAGTGDVLTGLVAVGLAAGLSGLHAAAAAAWVHADAARRCPPAGLLAGDLVEMLPGVLTGLR